MALEAFIAVGLVAPVAGAFAFVLWMARMPGDPAGARSPRATAAIMAGIIAGVLMGPMVLGRLAPDFHNSAFVGSSVEMKAFDLMLSEHRAERAALLATGVSSIALDELRERQDTAAEEGRASLDAAANAHRRALLLWGLVPLTMLAGVGLGAGGAVRRAHRNARTMDVQLGAVSALKQLALLVLGFALVMLIARLFMNQWWPAAALAAGMSLVGIPAMGSRRRTGWAACVAGQAIAAASLAGATVLSAAVAWLGGSLAARPLAQRRMRTCRQLGAAIAYGIALPAAIALALATIDPGALLADRSFVWLALLAFLIGGDLRWAGVALGTPEDVRGTRWRDAAMQIDRGTGTLQALSAASIALLGPMIALPQAHTIAAALLIGAITIELGKPIRHGMARSLDARDLDPK